MAARVAAAALLVLVGATAGASPAAATGPLPSECTSPHAESPLASGMHTFYVEATNKAANALSPIASRSFTIAPAGVAPAGAGGGAVLPPIVAPPAPKALAPALSSLTQSAARWREGSALARIADQPKAPRGTTFSFTVNEAAVAQLICPGRGRSPALRRAPVEHEAVEAGALHGRSQRDRREPHLCAPLAQLHDRQLTRPNALRRERLSAPRRAAAAASRARSPAAGSARCPRRAA
jgi:hypothetical protein